MARHDREASARSRFPSGAVLRQFILSKDLKIATLSKTAHADGTVRLWDAGHGDEIENRALLQVDIVRAVGRHDNVDISRTSFAGTASELSVGLKSGEVVVFRWGLNKHPGQEFSPWENQVQNTHEHC